MASALHSRYLLSTDLEQQAEDAAKQLTACGTVGELGLRTRHGIEGQCLDLYMGGEAGTVAALVERLWERDIYITWITPETEEERVLLVDRVYGMAEIADL